MSQERFLGALFGGLLSLLASLVVGRHYFKQSSRELRAEIDRLSLGPR
jgi:hypothetical protein